MMIDNYMLNQVLDKTKNRKDIEHFDNTKILIDTDDKLPNNITLKDFLILMTCVI